VNNKSKNAQVLFSPNQLRDYIEGDARREFVPAPNMRGIKANHHQTMRRNRTPTWANIS
jgi:hypothetical protein